jgi:hypothetical protein
MARQHSSTIPRTDFAGIQVPVSGPFKKYVRACKSFYCWYDGQFIGARATPYEADVLLTDKAYNLARLEGWKQGYQEAMQDLA